MITPDRLRIAGHSAALGANQPVTLHRGFVVTRLCRPRWGS